MISTNFLLSLIYMSHIHELFSDALNNCSPNQFSQQKLFLIIKNDFMCLENNFTSSIPSL